MTEVRVGCGTNSSRNEIIIISTSERCCMKESEEITGGEVSECERGIGGRVGERW
jgi:hypothetical protein